jgi:uncharacterized OB-fold protein
MTTPGPHSPNPVISPSPDALEFWDGCRAGELRLPRCNACSELFFYPRALCPRCGSRDLSWQRVTGRGRLHSFCVQFHCAVPGYTGAVPFVTALVDLDEGPRMMSLLVEAGTDPLLIHIGTSLEVAFQDTDSGWPLPVFRPVPADGSEPT